MLSAMLCALGTGTCWQQASCFACQTGYVAVIVLIATVLAVSARRLHVMLLSNVRPNTVVSHERCTYAGKHLFAAQPCIHAERQLIASSFTVGDERKHLFANLRDLIPGQGTTSCLTSCSTLRLAFCRKCDTATGGHLHGTLIIRRG